MSALLFPIHVEGIGLANVRFFAPPDGGREFPWPSIDDLFAAIVMDRRMRRSFRSDIGHSPWAGATRWVATTDGRTLIGQHFVAQGLIDAWAQVGRCEIDLYRDYAVGGAKALSKITVGFGPDELMTFVADAMKAGGGA